MLNLRFAATLILCAVTALSPPTSQAAEKDRGLTVMTFNMDGGTNFGRIFLAQTFPQLVAADSLTYAEIVASNIPERATGIADQIASAEPDLVALQEVFTYSVGPFPGTATTVTADALQSLLDALEQRGQRYVVAGLLTNLDATVPALDPATGLFSVRAVEHDAVLVRRDLPVSQLKIADVQVEHFAATATFNSPLLGPIKLIRGWIAVDARKRGKNYRFVTAHLDSNSPLLAAAQARELVTGPGDTSLPLVVAGDFNSDAESANPVVNAAWRTMLEAGFVDVWSAIRPSDPGYTWPLHGEAPYTPVETPNVRIDLVFARGKIRPVDISLIANTLSELTPSGLWPSDHAGLAATFVLEP